MTNMRSHTYENTIIVVAGGASGMGEQVVRHVASDAKAVFILDRSIDLASGIAHDIPNVSAIETELSDARSVATALATITNQAGDIDYFFNFAGTFMAGEIRDTPAERWQVIFDTNIPPILVATQQVYALMRTAGKGSIINTASAAGVFPVPAMSLYGATKSAVMSLTLGLRSEAKSFGVNVSVVCPTIVNTPLYDTALYNNVNVPKALHALKDNPSIQQSDVAARRILRHVLKNKAIIHTSIKTKLTGLLFHIAPRLYLYAAHKFFAVYRKSLRNS